jgi:hypothetical protein
MKALSIRQPHIHAILHLGKRVENRTDARGTPPMCRYRGPLLLHASGASAPRAQAQDAYSAAGVDLPAGKLLRGGIVGRAVAVGHLRPDGTAEVGSEELTAAHVRRRFDLRWWRGGHAMLLGVVEELPFVACKGALGLWTVPDEVLTELARLQRCAA